MNAKSIVLISVAMFCGYVANVSMRKAMESSWAERQSTPSGDVVRTTTAPTWPPTLGQRYPDLELTDLNGERVELSEYHAGSNVLLIEAVGLSCKACQAFAGGHEIGGLFGHAPQPGLRSLEKYIQIYGRSADLDSDRLVTIQILFYGPNGGDRCPTLAEARQWAAHFKKANPKVVFLLADQTLTGPKTRKLIPGFHLVDRHFVLRCDAGNPPRGDLSKDFIPSISRVLAER